MRTIKQLKALIGYAQTDNVFLDYLQQLSGSGVIRINDADIDTDAGTVSDDFYERMAAVYGVELDNELNAVNREEDK
jgi:hypothetical protein